MSTTPPPSSPPPTPPGGEVLEQGGGEPVGPSRGSGSRKRLAVLGVGGAAVLALAGGGVWAATAYFGTGDQAAQALPASTVGYLSVDLDPSGEQKLAALRTLQKFPAFTDAVDLDAEDDLRQKIGESVIAEAGCDLDYADDVAPWIGDRFAVAAVDLGEETPTPVGVVQVSDPDAAEEGLAALAECGGGGGGEEGGFAVEGDWALVAESDDVAEEVAAEAAEGSLADDDDFTRWTGETGDAGIVTGYLAPEAGALLAELGSGFGGLGPGAFVGTVDAAAVTDPAAAPTGELPPELEETLEDFQGAAMSVRFADDGVELEVAADSNGPGGGGFLTSDQGAAAMSTLPEDTVAAYGLGFEDGWVAALVQYLEDTLPEEAGSIGDQLTAFEDASGLDLPADAETLFGDSATIALGGGGDLGSVFASEDLSALPVGVKVQGEPEEIEGVLDKLRAFAGDDPVAESVLGSDSEGDALVVGPNPDYRAEAVGDGGLGDTELFGDVVADADEAAAVLFVSFDGLGAVADELSGGDPEVTENLEPLAGLGISGRVDEDVAHAVLRVTTD